MLQDLQEKLDVLKRDTLTPRAIALTRKSLLNRGDGYGLACLIYQVLQQSVDCFLRACRHLNPGSLSTNPSFLLLHDCIQIHLKCSRMDPSLGEELGAQGTHMQLRRVIQFDLSDVQGRMSEEDVDTIIALQDLACEVAVHGHFPMKVSPFSRDTLIERLPLTFEIKPMRTLQNVCDEGGDREIVLIHQVSMRQSAQEDVGFVMWPSAVVLSRWLISNSSILSKASRILEIGAGCGLVGLLAARLQQSKAADASSSEILLSDFNPTVLENLDRNIALNGVADSCQTVGLDFYQQSGVSCDGWLDMDGRTQSPVDVVLAADMICQPSDAVYAANTIHDTLRCGGQAYVVCADAAHRFGVDQFARECKRVGLLVTTENVANMYDGQLVQGSDMEKTAGFVGGMSLTLFLIEKLN